MRDDTAEDRPVEYRQYRFRRPPRSTEVFLVRHGESAAVVPGVPVPLLDGQDDPGLARDGRWQADRVRDRLSDQQIDAIYVSTLRRTHETAAPLAEKLGITPNVEPDLREIHLGEWEGGAFRRHLAERHPIALQMLERQRWDVIPGAESSEAFGARVRSAVERICAAHPDQRIVAVAHGGVIGELVRQAVDSSQGFAFGADNGSITHLVVTPDRWVVRRFNDTAHLGGFDLDPAPGLPKS